MEGGDGSEKGMVVGGWGALFWRLKTVWHDSVLTFTKKNIWLYYSGQEWCWRHTV